MCPKDPRVKRPTKGFEDRDLVAWLREFRHTLEIITRTLREVVNREKLCGTSAFYFGCFRNLWGCQTPDAHPVRREASRHAGPTASPGTAVAVLPGQRSNFTCVWCGREAMRNVAFSGCPEARCLELGLVTIHNWMDCVEL